MYTSYTYVYVIYIRIRHIRLYTSYTYVYVIYVASGCCFSPAHQLAHVCACACVCVERERERERTRERENVRVCVCEREREYRACVWRRLYAAPCLPTVDWSDQLNSQTLPHPPCTHPFPLTWPPRPYVSVSMSLPLSLSLSLSLCLCLAVSLSRCVSVSVSISVSISVSVSVSVSVSLSLSLSLSLESGEPFEASEKPRGAGGTGVGLRAGLCVRRLGCRQKLGDRARA